MRVIFMGTPEFAAVALQRLLASPHQVVAVVTGEDKPAGRGRPTVTSPVKQIADSHGLPLLQPGQLNDPGFVAALRAWAADLFVVVAFRILPREVFTLPPRGTLNVHASLLPRYRGAAPIQWAIINGETETGVTTFLIDEKVDTGGILLQQRTAIGESETFGELHDRLAEMGAILLLHTLDEMEKGRLEPQPQQGEVTRAPKITKAIAEIDWRKPAAFLRNLIRGLNPVPGAFTFWQGQVFKIHAAQEAAPAAVTGAPGEICHVDVSRGELWVSTGMGALALHEVQLPGKRRMAIAEFLRGHRVSRHDRLGAERRPPN